MTQMVLGSLVGCWWVAPNILKTHPLLSPWPCQYGHTDGGVAVLRPGSSLVCVFSLICVLVVLFPLSGTPFPLVQVQCSFLEFSSWVVFYVLPGAPCPLSGHPRQTQSLRVSCPSSTSGLLILMACLLPLGYPEV